MKRRFTTLKSVLFMLATTVLLVVFVNAGFNYSGVCTEGIAAWRWHRVEPNELQIVLRERGGINESIRTEYSFPNRWEVPGDEYQPATFLDKIRGRASLLVKYHQPWLDNGNYLITGGYFYTPNCISAWRPPE
ncbi:hypothetical protein IE4872_CH01866 [Rhizobium gallicum]|uniref:Uncharacterized protein n=1 Tax=Rhizobium gallicum TaxID=56730 RepID=A0A1L5NHZ7_9HYPH|nr:hypothetical protein [Rhizobium gallicum]APO67491.1 hypothetical protein IE4872_CH01866 [Rhizobium gallicum]